MKKRFLGLFLTVIFALSLMPVSASAESNVWKSFYVSPVGSDDAAGTETAPFKTLMRAQEEVRKYNQNMQGDIVVNLMPGRYQLTRQWELEQEDSGFNGFNVIWQGTDPDNLPTISGAEEVTGEWTKGEDGIWHVKAENLNMAREMFVNGKAAVRAKTSKKVYGGKEYTRAVNYSHPYRGDQTTEFLGFYADKAKIGIYENPEDVEIHSTMIFRTAMFHVTDIIQDPDNEYQVIVMLDEYWNEYRIGNNTEWVPSRGFVVENAYELLDQPGEFYFNKKTKTLSYLPYEGEDMNSAEVLVPTVEQLMYIHGGNYDNLMQNVRFENVRFAHATSYELEENDNAGGQGDFHYLQESVEGLGKFAINIDWAKNIGFEACTFYGISPHCLYLRNGVYDSEVTGCVFSDLGGHGIMGGSIRHDILTPHKDTDGPSDAAFQGAWTSSYPMGGMGYGRAALNLDRTYDAAMQVGSGWYSDPLLSEADGNPWVRIEMLAEKKLESIEFSFPKNATEIQRSNFEILVSNDRYFKEYETIKTFDGPVDFKVKVEVESDKPWRYIMFRKTKLEAFALNGVWAWSNEMLPQGNDGLTKNNKICNNYFTRVGQQKWCAVPIFLMYTANYEVSHNTIYDVPYTGISVGWGWWHTPNNTAGGNKINYNHIEDCTKSANDGGCIYIFGLQNQQEERSEIRGNFLSNATSGWGCALYMDSGNCGINVYDNAALNVRDAIAQNNSYGEITVKNFWTGDSTLRTFTQLKPNNGAIYENVDKFYKENKDLFDMDDPIQYVYSDIPEAVARIQAEAGIEDEWRWILDRVPVGDDVQRTILIGPDATEAERIKATQGMIPGYGAEIELGSAKHILTNGTFGTLPWNFKPETKVALENAIEAFTEFPNREGDYAQGHIEDQELIKDGLYNAYKLVEHPDYETMISMCEDFAKSADTNQYLKADIEKFKKAVNTITAAAYENRGDKAVAARKLEKAYSDLYNTNRVNELTAVYVEEATTVMDAANKKTTVTLPYGVKAQDAKIYYFTAPNCEIVADLNEIDYSFDKVSIPLYNSLTQKYDAWTVVFEESKEVATAGRISANPADWTAGNINSTYQNVAGYMTIEPWFQPSMYKKLMNNQLSFSLWAPRPDRYDGINIIFGAQTCENIDANAYQDGNTFYKLKFVNQDLTLSLVKGGKEKVHYSVYESGFNYGEFNDFEIVTQEHHGINRITVKLNGATVMDTLVAEPIGATGYFGILSKNMAVKVK
ncbi:MAG: hypothetical protein II997_05065 [Clostridia bacterium]|nr:hypothetical protein [Clostridia bacterium]